MPGQRRRAPRRARRSRAPRRPWRAGRGAPGGPRASRRPGLRREAGRRAPGPWKASDSTVQAPMLGIVSRRRQLGSCAARSTRPEATSRAARIVARARLPASPQASSSAGERPARRSGEGGARSVPQALAAPVAPDEPALDRRCAARLDQLLADRPHERLERLGPAPRPQPGLARGSRGPPADRGGSARWNSDRSWSVPSAKRMRSIAPRARRRASGASARILTRLPAAQARVTTGSSPTWRSRSSTAPRRSSTPSRPGWGMR